MKVLVTGAGGFIGKRLCAMLREQGADVVGIGRSPANVVTNFHCADITMPLPSELFAGVDVVMHLAAKAHALSEIAQDAEEYDRVNTLGTQHVLEAAQRAGVKRLIFFSTVKAMGEETPPHLHGDGVDEQAACEPQTEYGRSKLKAEQLVLHGKYVPEPVVLRLCMLYGGKEKGNLSRMILAIAAKRFPPIPELHNRRSIVHVDDVATVAILCATHPVAVGKTYLVTDGRSYSTREMYDLIRAALGKRPAAFEVPLVILKALASVGDLIGACRGKRFMFDSGALTKLSGNSFYSNRLICSELGFTPRWNLQSALPAMLADLGLADGANPQPFNALPSSQQPSTEPPLGRLNTFRIKRLMDIALAVPLFVVGMIPLAILALAVRLTSRGPALHWSDRVGRDNRIFEMPKFRTMRIDTPQVASHLLASPDAWITTVGKFLRKTSLDELPQLWSILKGDMSFVGPRPALYNQHDLIEARTRVGVDKLLPGLTGWAQINGRDELPIPTKVAFDQYYLEHQSLALDWKILFLTAWKVVKSEGTAVPSQIAARSTQEMSDALVESGRAWFRDQNYERALIDLNQALRLRSDDAATYDLRGRIRLAVGEIADAIDDFSQAIRFNPMMAIAFHHRATAWEQLGDVAKAEHDHLSAAKLDPSFAVMHLGQKSSERTAETPAGVLSLTDEVG